MKNTEFKCLIFDYAFEYFENTYKLGYFSEVTVGTPVQEHSRVLPIGRHWQFRRPNPQSFDGRSDFQITSLSVMTTF
jgi:hypothetical protein